MRLLVRTQKLPEFLRFLGEDPNGINNNVRLDDQNLLLRAAKNGLDMYIAKAISKNEHEDSEQAKAFLKDVLGQQQRRSYHTQDWVQGGDFGCSREHNGEDLAPGGEWEDRSKAERKRMQMRFTVAGLLFGFEEQILTPIRTTKDIHMFYGALRAVRAMHAIMLLDESATMVVESFQKIDWTLHRGNCADSEELSAVLMECEATCMGTLGALFKGPISQDKWPKEIIQWAVDEVCNVVHHATSVTIVRDMEYHAAMLNMALWCLAEMFEGSQTPSGALAESLCWAAQKAFENIPTLHHLPPARKAIEEALRLFKIVYGP